MKYRVQFAIVKQVEVDAVDELQAEQVGFERLSQQERSTACALKVLDEDDEIGALTADTRKSFDLVVKKFKAFDKSWVAK